VKITSKNLKSYSKGHCTVDYTYNGDVSNPLVEIEKQFYKDHFSIFLAKFNSKQQASKQPGKIMTMNQFFRDPRYRPECHILRIGNKYEHASVEELWTCATAYIEEFNKIFNDYCQTLVMALYQDRATPYVEIHRVYIATDEDGDLYVDRQKALTNWVLNTLGTTPQPSAQLYYNRYDRNLFYNICKKNGLNVEYTIQNPNKCLTLPQYTETLNQLNELENIISQHKDMLNELVAYEANISELTETVLHPLLFNTFFADKHGTDLDNIQSKDSIERLIAYLDIMEKAENTYGSDYLDKFIRREWLQDKYDDYLASLNISKNTDTPHQY